MATRSKGKERFPVITDWKGGLPEYVRWLHRSAMEEKAADEYTAGHIAGFLIREADVILCPDLAGIKMVYLVYKERNTNGNVVL